MCRRPGGQKVYEIENEIDFPTLHPMQYFTDSRDVLSWITNTKGQFQRYVASRRNQICKLSSPQQWHYISTKENPADLGTRPITVDELLRSRWISGTEFLQLENPVPPTETRTENKTLLYTVDVCSYFNPSTRHIGEEITSGEAWGLRLRMAGEELGFQNEQEVSVYLQRQMQAEAWPQGLDLIYKLPGSDGKQLRSTSPFLDERDGL